MARQFGYRHAIAALQIVFFSLALPCACYMAYTRRNGWFGIGGLSIIRLVGASCLLVTLTNNARSVWAGVFVCESLGVVLLLFLVLGMMDRANHMGNLINPWFFRGPYLVSWAGISLTVADFAILARDPDATTAPGIAGLVLFLAIFAITAALAVFFFLRRAALPQAESRQVVCVLFPCVAPALAVRVTYTLLGRFAPGDTFGAIGGDPSAYLFMAAAPEFVVVAACTAVIFRHGRDWRSYEKVVGGHSHESLVMDGR